MEAQLSDPPSPPPLIDPSAPSRQLLQVLRHLPSGQADGPLPESVLWRAYCELRRRGEAGAEAHFLRTTRALLRRRSMGVTDLPTLDVDPDEHKLVDDAFLGELWKAYKRCITQQRTGPAAQLLRDIEAQIGPS
jgi:hypothetical protein